MTLLVPVLLVPLAIVLLRRRPRADGAARAARSTTLLLASVTSLGLAGSAAAATPTIGTPTIIPAGERTPVDIAGNHLHQGATVRRGTELRRWLVTLHGASAARVALRCGPGAEHAGLGLQEDAKVFPVTAPGAAGRYGRRSIDVTFHAAPDVDTDGARASVYALCTKASPVGRRLVVDVQQLLFYDDPAKSYVGSLQRGESFRVRRVSPSGLYAYGFAYGKTNRMGWVRTAGLV